MRKFAMAFVWCAMMYLGMASTASGAYYISKSQAQHYTKDAVSSHYEDTAYSDVIAVCRPQGRNRGRRGYVYHRWACGFAIRGDEYEYCDDPENEFYGGQFLIAGNSGGGRYSYKVLRGLHCF